MPCTFRDNVVLVPDALSGLLIHPAPTTKNKSYTPVPQGKIIYPGWLIKTIGTICMSYLRGAKLIVLLQMNDYALSRRWLALLHVLHQNNQEWWVEASNLPTPEGQIMRTYVNTFSNVPTKVLTYSHLQSLTQGFGLGPESILRSNRKIFRVLQKNKRDKSS